MKISRIKILTLILVLCTYWTNYSQQNVSAAENLDSPNANWNIEKPQVDVPYQGVVFRDSTDSSGSSLTCTIDSLQNTVDISSNKAKSCRGQLGNSNANGVALKYLAYRAVIPVCENNESVDCISNFWLKSGASVFKPKFESYFPASSKSFFARDEKAALPEGKSASLWSINNSSLGVVDGLFAVRVVLQANNYSNFSNFEPPSISINIDKVSKILAELPRTSSNLAADSVCVVSDFENSQCLMPENNLSGVEYGISIRLSNPPVAWIHGRFLNPNFQIRKTGGISEWSIEAKPVLVPTSAAWVTHKEYVERIKFLTFSEPKDFYIDGPYSSGPWAIKAFEKWSDVLGEKAKATQLKWSMKTVWSKLDVNGISMDSCRTTNGIAGILLTNATVYMGDPPLWNEKENSLDYKVGAPHLLPSGVPFQGRYELIIDQQFARCLYKVGDLPINATVSIINDSGTSIISTSAVSNKATWIFFKAEGFTFSMPVIQSKLTEDLTMKTSIIKVKKSTITCVKGKVTKKVTAVKPKCPAGYKKK